MAAHNVYIDGTDSAGTFHFLTLYAAIEYMKANFPYMTADNGSGGAGPVNYIISNAVEETTPINITGFGCDETGYLNIYTTGAARHAGVWSDSCHRIVCTNPARQAVTVSEEYVRLDGLQIRNASVNASGRYALHLSSSGDLRVSNCIVRSAGNATYEDGPIYSTSNGAGTFIYIWNTIAYGGNTALTVGNNCPLSGYFATAYVYNCTFTGGYRGINNEGATNLYIKNTYVGAPAYSCIAGSNITQSYTATSDDTSSGTGCVDYVACDTTEGAGHAGFTNVTAGRENFTLKSGSILKEAGNTAGGSAPLDYTTDIAGTTRS